MTSRQQAQLAARFRSVSPQFRVADLVATAAHYRDLLGFALGDFFGDPPAFVMVQRDAVVIHLGQAEADEATRPPGELGYNAYVWVDDVDRLAAEYARSGADVVEGPVDRVYLCRELVVRDCNGLVLCFAADLAKS